ncbi:MAG: CotH kinase family protein [Bacteroidaceae bacterium]|nr:CotH kinase family protein [Bacteroidaceae bacterium]
MKRIFSLMIGMMLALMMWFMPGTKLSAQTLEQKTNLPTLYVDVEGKAAVTDKKLWKTATMTLVADGQQTVASMKIRCRGNSTFTASKAKLAYRMKFDEAIALLGEGHATAHNWVLMANAYDKTMLRNALTSNVLASFLGMPFCPGAQFVDLVLNGTYVGTYQITDHPEANDGRLDLGSDLDSKLVDRGYFLEADGWEDHKCFKTQKNQVPVRVHSPKDGEYTTTQISFISAFVNKFEAALMGNDFRDPDKGYRQYVDSISLANLYIGTEMCANPDGFYSMYMYKKAGDEHLYFGPMWDYDIAYGNDYRKGDTSESLMSEVGFGVARTWFARMWGDPWFRQLINNRWKELVAAGIEQHLLGKVDEMAAEIEESQKLNYQKYSINTVIYHECVTHSTYAEYVADLKTFIRKHTAFLTKTFDLRAAEPVNDDGTFKFIDNYYYRIRNVNNNHYVDVNGQSTSSGASVVTWEENTAWLSQQWSIKASDTEGYVQFINRLSGLALNDPTPGTAMTSTQLNVVTADATSDSQLWSVQEVNNSGVYNLVNKKTGFAMNNNAGSSENGNKVISYTSDDRNLTSLNRQWYIQPYEVNTDEIIHGGEDIIEDVNRDGVVDSQDVLMIYDYMQKH